MSLGYEIDWSDTGLFDHPYADVTDHRLQFRLKRGSDPVSDPCRVLPSPAHGRLALADTDGRFIDGDTVLSAAQLGGRHLIRILWLGTEFWRGRCAPVQRRSLGTPQPEWDVYSLSGDTMREDLSFHYWKDAGTIADMLEALSEQLGVVVEGESDWPVGIVPSQSTALGLLQEAASLSGGHVIEQDNGRWRLITAREASDAAIETVVGQSWRVDSASASREQPSFRRGGAVIQSTSYGARATQSETIGRISQRLAGDEDVTVTFTLPAHDPRRIEWDTPSVASSISVPFDTYPAGGLPPPTDRSISVRFRPTAQTDVTVTFSGRAQELLFSAPLTIELDGVADTLPLAYPPPWFRPGFAGLETRYRPVLETMDAPTTLVRLSLSPTYQESGTVASSVVRILKPGAKIAVLQPGLTDTSLLVVAVHLDDRHDDIPRFDVWCVSTRNVPAAPTGLTYLNARGSGAYSIAVAVGTATTGGTLYLRWRELTDPPGGSWSSKSLTASAEYLTVALTSLESNRTYEIEASLDSGFTSKLATTAKTEREYEFVDSTVPDGNVTGLCYDPIRGIGVTTDNSKFRWMGLDGSVLSEHTLTGPSNTTPRSVWLYKDKLYITWMGASGSTARIKQYHPGTLADEGFADTGSGGSRLWPSVDHIARAGDAQTFGGGAYWAVRSIGGRNARRWARNSTDTGWDSSTSFGSLLTDTPVGLSYHDDELIMCQDDQLRFGNAAGTALSTVSPNTINLPWSNPKANAVTWAARRILVGDGSRIYSLDRAGTRYSGSPAKPEVTRLSIDGREQAWWNPATFTHSQRRDWRNDYLSGETPPSEMRFTAAHPVGAVTWAVEATSSSSIRVSSTGVVRGLTDGATFTLVVKLDAGAIGSATYRVPFRFLTSDTGIDPEPPPPAPPPTQLPFADATLASLTVGGLVPTGFSANSEPKTMTVTLPSGTTTAVVAATAAQSAASVSGTGSQTVSNGSEIDVTVSHPGVDGVSQARTLIYSVTVLIAGAPPPPTPDPDITSFTTSHTARKVGESYRLSWSVDDATGVTLDGIGVSASGTHDVIATQVGTKTHTLRATGPSGTTPDTATVTVTVTAAPAPDPGDPPTVAFFYASPSTIQAGGSSTLAWSTSGATSVTINGQPRSASGSLTVTPTRTSVYTLRVRNANGSTTRTATVTVAPPAYSTLLSSLTASGISFTQPFSPTRTSYFASTPNSDSLTIISATAQSSTATVTGTGSWVLAVGSNTRTVTVRDGSLTRKYTITIIRAAPAKPKADSSLSALAASGLTLSPAFSSGTGYYTATAAHDDTATTISATATDSANATITGLGTRTLSTGVNRFNIVVTNSRSGYTPTSTIYSIVVSKAAPPPPRLTSLSLTRDDGPDPVPYPPFNKEIFDYVTIYPRGIFPPRSWDGVLSFAVENYTSLQADVTFGLISSLRGTLRESALSVNTPGSRRFVYIKPEDYTISLVDVSVVVIGHGGTAKYSWRIAL